MRVLVLLCCLVAGVAAEARCKVTKVHAVCESRCEDEAPPGERTSVPPPGTLMPPSNIGLGQDEGSAPNPMAPDFSTPADGSSLLEVGEGLTPAVTITKSTEGKFLAENVGKAVNQVNLPPGLSDTKSARILFANQDLQNLAEMGAGHFAAAESSHPLVHPAMTCSDVEQHINPVPLLSWTSVRTASFGCADGRSSEEGLSTWGGDIAEMATALNVYEQMASIHLSQADVSNILRKYLETSSREHFATCMSGLSVRQLFGASDDPESTIKNPPEEQRAALWMKIADPNFVGNEHIRFMLENSAGYSVRKELVQHLIHSFFDILWNQFDPLRSKLRVQILPGEHNERAVVIVTSPEYCLKDAGLAPLIAPRSSLASVVILNPNAVQVMRRELALFFSRATTPIIRADEMIKRFSVLAAGQGALTKKVMYDRIPTFSATIKQ